jgi:hypothetical protein
MTAAGNVYTYSGAILVMKTVDVSDDTVKISYTGTKDAPMQKTWGTNSPRVPKPGPATYEGEVTVIYDYATGATTAARLLATEWATPTVGGLGVIVKPTGEGSGEEEVTLYLQLTKQGPIGDEADKIQVRTYSFNVVGQPTIATQTT